MVVAWGVFLHLSTRGVSKKQMKFWDRKLSENQVNFLFFFFGKEGPEIMTLFGKPEDGEDGRLASQRTILPRFGC